jgi:hypothetical protein
MFTRTEGILSQRGELAPSHLPENVPPTVLFSASFSGGEQNSALFVTMANYIRRVEIPTM